MQHLESILYYRKVRGGVVVKEGKMIISQKGVYINSTQDKLYWSI